MFILKNALYSGAAGLAVGFLVLGILPFIERAFRITTSMTLLELADASHPLLRRLSLEAPGTYNHSLQVASLAEEAAESIGANSLLCRVASYYHDVGKINKAEYFVENQTEGQNRHINLSPNVSLLIILGHVKDGIELARDDISVGYDTARVRDVVAELVAAALEHPVEIAHATTRARRRTSWEAVRLRGSVIFPAIADAATVAGLPR